ncbi:fused MFS/spermidine synthase [Actinoplanes sp. NPDC049596]|uniref:spermidine synthase n=1 Tax=unclassified Actinoplanes TaxID=2626549 RepID=UPI00342AAE1B
MHAAIDHGTAELRPDPARPQGWTLLVDGIAQSYVDLGDPGHLEFPYFQQMGRVLRRVPPRVLHLGGGALTLARLLHHRRPDAVQHVVERDAGLVTLVSRFLPFPEQIEVTVGDARDEVERRRGYDLIIVDVFEGAWAPASVGSTGFAAAARRALTSDGLLAMNLTDVPPLAHSRVQAATVREVFGDVVALYGDAAVVKGRRAGNLILLAGNVPMIKVGKHERTVRGTDLAEFIGGARPRLDELA